MTSEAVMASPPGVWTGKENALNWLFLSLMETVKVGGGKGPGC